MPSVGRRVTRAGRPGGHGERIHSPYRLLTTPSEVSTQPGRGTAGGDERSEETP
ncbi:hypothetical protein ABZ807_11015 [Micromonospora sp. NPDC047548]|uniref:hypothetical protein n=1 Tax=Micromonospora sp. NPDC047548 TaxID=3155624 RepID=UPI0033F94271